GQRALEQLTSLVEPAAEPTLRAYLAALAVLSEGAAPGFTRDQLMDLRGGRRRTLNDLELSFIDPLPGSDERFRSFSRRFARALHDRLIATQADHVRFLHREAARPLEVDALREPTSEQAGVYLSHVFAARHWEALIAWMAEHVVPFPLLSR